MNKQTFDHIVDKHHKFLREEPGGECAVFDGENMEGFVFKDVVLRGASFKGTNLRGAQFHHVVLSEANLQEANLNKAYISSSMFSRATLYRARLDKATIRNSCFYAGKLQGSSAFQASLTGVNLTAARLESSNFKDVSFNHCNLQSTQWDGCDLTKAKFDDCHFSGWLSFEQANWTEVKVDILSIVAAAENEVEGLLAAINEGNINGNVYSGDCACLVGTVARMRSVHWNEMKDIVADSDRPAERFFIGIREGETPRNNYFAKLAYEWIREWWEERKIQRVKGVSR